MQVEKLHWQPETTFRQGIAKTIDWYANQVELSELEKQFDIKLFER
jgi:dTDP-D-glucose 4,6-dehydratase